MIASANGRTFRADVTRGEAWRRIREATTTLAPSIRSRCAPPSPRFKDNDKLNTMKLPLERRPSGRWRFEQKFKGGSEKGSKVKIDILGSLNSDFSRAQGWFKFRVVLGPDEDLPEGTIGKTGKVRWRVSQR